MLSKACTDIRFLYSAQGGIFNKILYMRNVHLAKGQACTQETNQSFRQGGCYIRIMTARVQLKKSLFVSLKLPGAKKN
jgi:hypothetical protein